MIRNKKKEHTHTHIRPREIAKKKSKDSECAFNVVNVSDNETQTKAVVMETAEAAQHWRRHKR